MPGFSPGLKEFEWMNDTTAYWRYPNGKSCGSIEDKMNHPVTSISYADVLAYCKWAKVRLPSLDEWEIASGLDLMLIIFGEMINPR
jgi:sulfatase modifying factor 1